MPKLLVGLTGGIASGKSTVARQLAAAGAVIIDSDLLAREVVEPGTPGLAAVRARFGEAVITPDGRLDRAALGQLVFADRQALTDLNAIVHPLVRARAAELTRAAAADSIVVQVIPLLVETGQTGDFDELVVIDVPESEQLRRLMRRNRLDQEAAQARIDAQASREQRLAIADYVIDSSASYAATQRQVRALWHSLQNRAASRPRPRSEATDIASKE